ncbi:MAG: serine hydrolase, partial [Gemmatimonadales bacterium]
DVARWVAFLTGAPSADPRVTASRYDLVLSRGTLAGMWRPVVPVGDGPESMGLSFFLEPLASGDTVVGHTGWQAGFRAFMYFHPGKRTAVIGVFNTSNDAEPRDSAARYDDLLRQAVELIAAM